MKVVQINSTCGVGSTGKICVGISQALSNKNVENYILYSNKSNGYKLGIKCSSSVYQKVEAIKSKILGNYGFNSVLATYKVISKLKRIRPDIVHIHNIHGHDCNIEMLFWYLKRYSIEVVWTFHDCWAFTAYCPHYTMVGCEKWQLGCGSCIQCRQFSWFLDKSRKMYNKKKRLFKNLNLTIVTPSNWLSGEVMRSFLRDYPVYVINNGIDLSIFKYKGNDFRKKYGLLGKNVLLGVAFEWNEKKGLDVFVELSKRFSDEYKIVLIGVNKTTEMQLPRNIIAIRRTQNQQEMAEIYSAADVFVNPTREENYPTVNMEALACGTPVVTFKTGGSPEIVDKTCGSVVECDDIDSLEKEIIRICSDKPYSREACIKKAKEFDKNKRFKEYLELYERINATRTEGN